MPQALVAQSQRYRRPAHGLDGRSSKLAAREHLGAQRDRDGLTNSLLDILSATHLDRYLALPGPRFCSESARRHAPRWGPARRRSSKLAARAHWHSDRNGLTLPHVLGRAVLRRDDPSAATATGAWPNWKSVPSTHIRCMMMASLRATATQAFFMPMLPDRSSSPDW